MTQHKDGVLFDLDGTLWNATGMAARTWNDVFAHEGLSLRVTPEAVRRLMGRTMDEIGAALFPELSIAEASRIMDVCGEAEVAHMAEGGATLYPHLADALEVLSARWPLAVVSNCQRGYAEGFIRCCGFERRFADYEESGRTGLGKADNLRLVMARLGLDRAVYVGDTEGDARAAREAGMPFIFAAYGFGRCDGPDAVIHGLDELPAAVEALLGAP